MKDLIDRKELLKKLKECSSSAEIEKIIREAKNESLEIEDAITQAIDPYGSSSKSIEVWFNEMDEFSPDAFCVKSGNEMGSGKTLIEALDKFNNSPTILK